MTKEEIRKLIIDECKKQGITKPEAIQYVLATVQHETNGIFLPVKEAYWLSEGWRKRHLRYYPYYGRGFVQLTWEDNYKKLGDILGINLVRNPDLALELNNAIFILVYGMKHGVFTGKKLDDYFNDNGSNFIKARKIINGMDKAYKISAIAQNVKIA